MSGQDLKLFVKACFATLLQFIYTTLVFIALQPRALARAIYSSYSHDKARRLGSHLLRVAVEDVTPMLMVRYGNDLLQNYDPEQSQSQNPETGYTLTALGFLVFVRSMQFAADAIAKGYIFRKTVQFGVRMVALTLEATDVANSNVTPMTICQEQHCNPLRFLKGSVRANLNYGIIEVLIKVVEYIPTVGPSASMIITIYHQGRYVTTLILPICNRHQEVYMVENPEFVLSQGFVYQSLSSVVPIGIEYLTSIPRVYYQSPMSQFLLIMQVSIAARMDLPKAVGKSTRYLTEPLALLSVVLDVIFEVVLLGLKRYIPQQFEKGGSPIPWDKVTSCILQIWSSPLVQKIRFFLLPRMLQSLHRFKNDPLISQHWESMRMDTLTIIREIQKYRRRPAVKTLIKTRKLTVEMAHQLWNLPRFATRFLIDFLQAPGVSNRLGDWERYLEQAFAGEPQSIIPGNKSFNADREPLSLPLTPREHPLADTDAEVNLALIHGIEVQEIARAESSEPSTSNPQSLRPSDEEDIDWSALNRHSVFSKPAKNDAQIGGIRKHIADGDDEINFDAVFYR